MVFGSAFRSLHHHHNQQEHQQQPSAQPAQQPSQQAPPQHHLSQPPQQPTHKPPLLTSPSSPSNMSSGVSSSTTSSYHTQYFYAEEAARMLSNEEISRLLEKNQNLTFPSSLPPNNHNMINNSSIVYRVDTNMYAANDPIEDRQAQVYDGEESFFAVYDGHAGDGCAAFLSSHLIPYLKFRLFMRQKVRQQMKERPQLNVGNCNLTNMEQMTDDDWNRAIESTMDEKERKLLQDMRNMVRYTFGIPLVLREAFVYTDSVFCKGALVRMIKGKQVIPNDLSGSCAIMAYIQKNQLWVANTGDCRAILARRDARTGQLQAIALSRDQTAESEEQRLRSEFPNERDIVYDGRIKGGLQPSRSFGDIMYKEPVIGILLPDLIKNQEKWNPPYVKAEPEIQHIELDTRFDEFMVIASDGLWDVLKNLEVVQLVEQFVRGQQYMQHDKANVSTFLIRQALLKSGYGRSDQEKLSNLMQLPTDFKRMLHDDITVTVIFFNKSYSTSTTASTQYGGFQEIDSRGETEISPLYINVLKEFSELIAQENK